MRILFRIFAALALVTGVTYFAGSAAASDAGARGNRSTVQVMGDGSHVTIDRTRVPAGKIRFAVSSTNPTPGSGSQITLLRLQPGVTLTQFSEDLAHEFSQDPAVAAQGTRELTRDARFFGLADVAPGTPATVTENLSPGTYHLIDLGNPPTGAPVTTTLTVVRGHHNGDGPDDAAAAALDDDHGRMASVWLTSADTFVVRGHLPARGSVRVTNVSDTLHFMTVGPVKPGTTDADVQAFFDSAPQGPPQGPPPFAMDGPSVGADVLSPGRSLTLSYDLPPGTYVLLCFVADDKTGMPHAAMGMHKVVTLK